MQANINFLYSIRRSEKTLKFDNVEVNKNFTFLRKQLL